MKWFQHYSNTYTNLKMQSAIRKKGFQAYGIFWLCCELVAQQGNNYRITGKRGWIDALYLTTRIRRDRLEGVIECLCENNLIDKKSYSKKGDLFIPKMANYSDDYTRRHSTVPEQTTDNVRQDKSRIDNTRKEDTIYTSEFEKFWKVYPRKVSKSESYKIWQKQGLDSLVDTIVQKVEEYKNSEQWNKEDGQFVPNPKNWLKDSRWEDEVQIEFKDSRDDGYKQI